MNILDWIDRMVDGFDKRPLAVVAAVSFAVSVIFAKLYIGAVEDRYNDVKMIQKVQQDKIDLQQHQIELQQDLQKSQNATYQLQIEKLMRK